LKADGRSMAVKQGTLVSLFQQYPGVFVAVELSILPVVDFSSS
jgi:hypothetical protein